MSQNDSRSSLDIPFSVSPRVVMQLGRQSISDSITAIIELVKNAFDADAENVRIRFLNLNLNSADLDDNTSKSAAPFLIIEDDGDGMTINQVQKKWMVIGVDDKARNRISRKHRTKVGEKGLGRLGLDRLCEKTRMFTVGKDSTETIELVIDWTKYENTEESLEQIKHKLYMNDGKYYTLPQSNQEIPKEKGTVLFLEALKDIWNQKALDDLEKELSLLVSPFGGVNDFQIWLEINDQVSEVTSSKMLDVAEWIVYSELSENNGEWIIRHHMEGRGKPDFNFAGKWSDIFPTDDEPPQCGSTEFFLYFIPRSSVEFDDLSFEQGEIVSFMNSNQGIRIYRDYFRVKPYGDPDGREGDWLGLAHRRQQHPGGRASGNWRVGYNQVVGAIFLERERNDNLLDQTNREGLVKEKGYFDLRKYALHAVSWFEGNDSALEKEIKEKTEKKSEQAKEKLKNTTNETSKTLDELDNTVDSVFETLQESLEKGEQLDLFSAKTALLSAGTKVKSNLDKTRSAQEQWEQANKAEKEALALERDYMANLASLGILAVSFGHETLRQANLVVGSTKSILEELPDAFEAQNEKDLAEILEDLNLIGFYSNQISLFADFMLTNVKRDKRTRIKTHLDHLVTEIFKVFEYVLVEKRKISVQFEFEENLPPIKAFPIDWESIFVNLITNSEWIFNARHIAAADRVIRVRMRENQGNLIIEFADSGGGLEVGNTWSKREIDNFFRPNISTRRDEKGDEIGTGMGLYIIRQIVSRYDGFITAEPKCDLGGAEFRITVPIPDMGGRGRRDK